MASKARRSDKSTTAANATSGAGGSTGVAGQIASLVAGLSDGEKACHRAAFLHLMQSMMGTEVDVDMTDGKKIKGIFHTATPFSQRSFGVAVKAARVIKV